MKPVYEKLQPKGFEIVAVAGPYALDKQKEFIAKEKLPYHFLTDSKEEGQSVDRDLYRCSGHPTTFIIGRDGKVAFFHLGFEEGDELKIEKEIERLLSMN